MKEKQVIIDLLSTALNKFGMKKYKQAEELLQQARNIEPINFSVNFNLARTKFHLGKKKEAKQIFSMLIHKFPQLVSNWITNETTCWDTEEFNHYSHCIQEPITQTERDQQIHHLLGEIFYSQRRWDPAKACFDEAIERDVNMMNDPENRKKYAIIRKNCNLTSH